MGMGRYPQIAPSPTVDLMTIQLPLLAALAEYARYNKLCSTILIV